MTTRRLVVLEGPDGSGKTTLARALRAEFGFGYRHEGPPPPDQDPLLYYQARLQDAVMESLATRGVVLDRFALGDRVYGPVLRGKDRLGDAGWAVVDGALEAVGALQVVCLPPYETCLAAWSRRTEYIQDEEVFRRTYERWRWAAGLPHQVTYDWTSGAPGDAFLDVLGKVRG